MFEKIYSIIPGDSLKNHPLTAALTLILITIISTLLLFYAKHILHISIVYTHFLYIPIILAAFRWGKKSLLLAIYFAFILIVPYALVFQTLLFDDLLRALIMIFVAWIAGIIGEKNKQNEKNLRNSRQLMSSIIDFLPDATFVIDLERKVIIWNQAIAALTGIPAADIIGKGDYEYALPFYNKREPILIDLVLERSLEYEEKYKTLQSTGETLEAEFSAPLLPEALLWAKSSPLHDTNGNLLGAIESIRIVR